MKRNPDSGFPETSFLSVTFNTETVKPPDLRLFKGSPDYNHSLILLLVMLVTAVLIINSICSCRTYAQEEILNSNDLVYAAPFMAVSLDPHFTYDRQGALIVYNIYESLVQWPLGNVDANESDLSYSHDPAELKPMLATSWSQSQNGKEYVFEIREGVTFHNGGDLTAEDVEYSFERAMLLDREGGPSWMLLEPLTGYENLRELVKAVTSRNVSDLSNLSTAEQREIYNQYIDPVVEASAGRVVFSLPKPHSPFLSILAYGNSVAMVIDKQWSIGAGCWDGSSGSWANWWNPSAAESALYNKANGTGPFKLHTWKKGSKVILDRFIDYWRGKASLERVVRKNISELSERLIMLEKGEADIVYVPSQEVGEVEGTKGTVIQKDLPTLSMNPVGFFTSPVKLQNNEYVGEGPWNGKSIPPDLFSSLKVRKAFCLAFDYNTFNNRVYGGSGYKTHGPIPKAISWAYNPDQELIWSHDLSKAEKLLKEARGGEIWKKGFTLPMLYNSGNNVRKQVAQILEANIEKINDSFEIEIHSMDWGTYLDYIRNTKAPFFVIGWLADFPGPHNFASPFVSSNGIFPEWQGKNIQNIFRNYFDHLVEQGIKSASRNSRIDVYHSISELSHKYATHLWVPQSSGVRVMRNWVQNLPFDPGLPAYYFYPTKKTLETITQEKENEPPEASFIISPPIPKSDQTVTFHCTSSDPDGTIVGYNWSFGEGTNSSAKNPTHSYEKPGTYTVKLTVTDDAGAATSATKEITVENRKPDASLTYSPEKPKAGQQLTFDATSSTDEDGTIESYKWDLTGDGSHEKSGSEVTNTYDEEGTYEVELTVTDDNGDSASTTQEVKITEKEEEVKIEEKYALVVGIADYKYDTINDLKYPAQDAKDFYQFLINDNYESFPKDNVTLLTNQQATSEAISQEMSQLVAGVDKKDLVIIYYSGHGATGPDYNNDEDDGHDEYFVTHDTNISSGAKLYSTSISDDQFGNWLTSMDSKQVAIFLDSCYSGGATKAAKGTSIPGQKALPNNKVFNDFSFENRLLFAASSENQPSWESPELKQGVFTHFLLEGLKGKADSNNDGQVTSDELYDCLKPNVSSYVDEHFTSTQTPPMKGAISAPLSEKKGQLEGEVEYVKEAGKEEADKGEYVVINLGKEDGVKVEDKFEVLYATKGVGVIEGLSTEIVITDVVGPHLAVGKVLGSELTVEEGYRVKKTS